VRLLNVRVLTQAYDEADRLKHGWVGVEHLLLAILRSDSAEDRCARVALEESGVSATAFETALLERLRDEATPPSSGVSLTPRAYTVMGRADGLALAAGHDSVGGTEVLLAILWEPHSLARTTLTDLGVPPASVTEVLARSGASVPAGDPPAAE
jgi:ATP-dependent Clp protease ATP-binding subunit ClpC